jgi:hypothetical protein
MTPKPVAAIVGMGDAYASVKNRKDPMQLAVEATYGALADAGLASTRSTRSSLVARLGQTSAPNGAISSFRTCRCR